MLFIPWKCKKTFLIIVNLELIGLSYEHAQKSVDQVNVDGRAVVFVGNRAVRRYLLIVVMILNWHKFSDFFTEGLCYNEPQAKESDNCANVTLLDSTWNLLCTTSFLGYETCEKKPRLPSNFFEGFFRSELKFNLVYFNFKLYFIKKSNEVWLWRKPCHNMKVWNFTWFFLRRPKVNTKSEKQMGHALVLSY